MKTKHIQPENPHTHCNKTIPGATWICWVMLCCFEVFIYPSLKLALEQVEVFQCPFFFFTYLFLYGPQVSVSSCWMNWAFPSISFPVQVKTSQHLCSLVSFQIGIAWKPNKTESRDHPNGQNPKTRKDSLQNGRPADLPVWDPENLIFFLFQFRW